MKFLSVYPWLFGGSRRLLYFSIGSLIILSTLFSCKDDEITPDPPAAQVQLQTHATLGSILVDKDGRTLYYFANDATAASSCSGGCEAFWPPFNIENMSAEDLGEGLSESDFSSISNASGKPQVTYKGRPLYYYAPLVNSVNTPEAAGETSGENVNGVWFVAKPDYSIMLTNAQLVGNDGKNYLSNYTEGEGKTIYFTDDRGVTLYTFKNDEPGKNNFTASDFSNNASWPIYETDQIVVPSSLDKTLFGTIDVFGKKQLTYKGWPLYFFGQDAGVMGANKGVSVPTPGTWPVAVKEMAEPVLKEVKLQTHATLGKILTDKTGRTLYYFVNDATAQNNCAGGCAALWPIFNVNDLTATLVGSGLSISDFTSISTAGGAQLTYKGRPLYYYAPLVNGANTIEAAGQTGGDNFNGVWFVAKPDYSIMLSSAQLIGLDGKSYLSDYTEGVGKTRYFTDARGVTLYTFTNDRENKNNFTAPDFSNNSSWPIYETDKVVVPSSLDKTLFGVIEVFGKKQLTYKGWPLYYFGSDAGVMGSNKGVSVPTPGKWPVGVKDMVAAVPQ